MWMVMGELQPEVCLALTDHLKLNTACKARQAEVAQEQHQIPSGVCALQAIWGHRHA